MVLLENRYLLCTDQFYFLSVVVQDRIPIMVHKLLWRQVHLEMLSPHLQLSRDLLLFENLEKDDPTEPLMVLQPHLRILSLQDMVHPLSRYHLNIVQPYFLSEVLLDMTPIRVQMLWLMQDLIERLTFHLRISED